jgi:hypothetical protein
MKRTSRGFFKAGKRVERRQVRGRRIRREMISKRKRHSIR